jgi:hypothetical protein
VSQTVTRKGVAAGLALGLLAMLATASADVAAQPSGQAFTPRDERPEDLPEGAGREETFYACTACHNFKLVAAQGLSRAQWDDSLTWMTTRHNMADIQGADRDLILDYLEKHYPPRAPSRAGGWRNPFAPP